MEYKVIIKDIKRGYEATSYSKREVESAPWKNVERQDDGYNRLEQTILDSALRIAHDRKKQRTRVIIKLD